MRSYQLRRAAAAATTLVLLPTVAVAATHQSSLTATTPVTWTPQVVPSAAVARPRVAAIDTTTTRTYAGGVFDTVSQGGRTIRGLGNLLAFSSTSGAVVTGFKPHFDGPVRAVEVAPDGGVFVGGDFTTVNGRSRPGLVKLTSGGAVDTRFRPYFSSGQVNDLELATIDGHLRLVVAGAMPKRLAAVRLATGADTGDLDATFSDRIPGARGTVSVFRATVAPNGKRLIATGNFRTVTADGTSHARRAFVMLDLPGLTARTKVDSWYYPGFAEECSATASGDARRIANLQGVDWSPDGSHLDVTATGKVPQSGDVWHAWDTDAHNARSSVCDGVGRFALADETQAVWINYSGGDSIWSVQDTGAAVYVQGHMQWMNNPDGFASRGIGDRRTGAPAAARKGVAAIDPRTGRAVAGWAPVAPAKRGGRALLATADGVWWGSDSAKFGGRARYGLAFTRTR
jgi:hypothetical protein